MREKIIGFLVLRKPETMGDVGPYNRIFELDGKFYRGVERSHLNDCIDDYFKKKLPVEIAEIVKNNKRESDYIFFPQEYIRNLVDAKKILDYSDKNESCEVVVMQSERIMEVKGHSIIDSKMIEWLGYDLTILQGGSLILGGVFFKPHLFAGWTDRLNVNGLFDSLDDCSEYFSDYSKMAEAGEVEDYMVSLENSEPIKLGKIKF